MKIAVTLFLIISLAAGAFSAGGQEARVLSLEEAISTALGENPGITTSEADIEMSTAAVRGAKSAYYPQIYTRLIVPFVGRESGFFLDQMIWDFGRTSNRVKSSKSQLEAVKFDGETAKDDIVLNTTVSYYNVLSKQHAAEARRKSVAEYERRLQRAEGFYEAGRGSKMDVTKADVDLGSARLELNTAENELAAARMSLMNAMGVQGGFNYVLIDSEAYETKELNIEESIDTALDRRPELKSLKAKEAAMNANLSATQKEFYPLIFGRTAYRFKGEGAETPGFIAGVGLEFNIFDGFKKYADVQSARAQLKRSQAEIQTARAEISSEIKQLYLDLKLAEENIHVTGDTKKSSEETLELARERYRLERASEVELAEAEALYSTTNASYMQAVYNYNITAARLERALGGGGELDQ